MTTDSNLFPDMDDAEAGARGPTTGILPSHVLRDMIRAKEISAVPEIEVTLPSGKIETLALEQGRGGRMSGSMPVTEGGLYRVSDGEKTALAAAGPLNPLEFEDLRASAEPLSPLIEASDGALVRLASDPLPSLRKVKPGRDRHGRSWIGVQANGGYVVTGVSQVPLLPVALILLLILGTALTAWWREGH